MAVKKPGRDPEVLGYDHVPSYEDEQLRYREARLRIITSAVLSALTLGLGAWATKKPTINMK